MNLLKTATAIGVKGFLHPEEIEKLAELAMNKEVCEVGSFTGLSCWAMAITAKHVTAVDTHKAATNGQRQTDGFTTLEEFKRATARYANVTTVVATSDEAARDIVVGPFDMIFLDAMHDYENVRDDIQRWWPKLRNGGVMALHDYRHNDFKGVEQAVDEIFGPAPEGTTVVTLRWVTKPL